MKPFFVYMLLCADGRYYVGHTDDLAARVADHQAGKIIGSYTRQRRPLTLVWSQEFATREEALAAELRIKGWGRAKKEALIRGDWVEIQRLAQGRSDQLAIPVRPELVEGSRGQRAGEGEVERGLRQAQPERVESSQPEWVESSPAPSSQTIPVRPEPVEGSRGQRAGEGDVERGLRQAQPERMESPQPERVESSQPERGEGSQPEWVESSPAPSSQTIPVRPEPVEGSRGQRAGEDPLLAPLLAGQRRAIAKTITLLESTRPDHRERADALLNALLPHTGQALRIGISGVPGVGKSTFIEALGLDLIRRGHKVAVLAIDPSSSLNGGSILGDKTRMEQLSVRPEAFIRPSPAAGTLGGVAEKTREALLVCEAAGFDVVIVETVGVGQSETAVARMTDLFTLLQLPNAGDDLQAIKRGVMELADVVVVNKADIDPDAAARAEAQIVSAMRLTHTHDASRVLSLSALRQQGLDTFWEAIQAMVRQRRDNGAFEARRQAQARAWMWDLVNARLMGDFRQHPAVRAALESTEQAVTDARIAPSAAARALLYLFERPRR